MWINWQWTSCVKIQRQSLLDNTLISLVLFKHWLVLVIKVLSNVVRTHSNVDPTGIWQRLQWSVWQVLNLYGKTVLYSVLLCSLWESLELNPNIKQYVTVCLLLHLNPNWHLNHWMFIRTRYIWNTGFKENDDMHITRKIRRLICNIYLF
jgi:hypothetical protein